MTYSLFFNIFTLIVKPYKPHPDTALNKTDRTKNKHDRTIAEQLFGGYLLYGLIIVINHFFTFYS